MSYEEMRAGLASLSKEEREQLALDLRMFALLDDPDYRAEISRRIADYKAGKFVTSDELHRLVAARGLEAA